MDLDDDELKATRRLNANLYKNVKYSSLTEKDNIIRLMAHDLLHLESKPYFYNIFTEEQVIEAYKRRVRGDSEWNYN